jgi:hypothetical protein
VRHHAFNLDFHSRHRGDLMLFHSVDDGLVEIASAFQTILQMLEVGGGGGNLLQFTLLQLECLIQLLEAGEDGGDGGGI